MVCHVQRNCGSGPGALSGEQCSAAGRTGTLCRGRSSPGIACGGFRFTDSGGSCPFSIRLCGAEFYRTTESALSLYAGGLRPRLDRCRRAPFCLLHKHSSGALYLSRAGGQQRRALEHRGRCAHFRTAATLLSDNMVSCLVAIGGGRNDRAAVAAQAAAGRRRISRRAGRAQSHCARDSRHAGPGLCGHQRAVGGAGGAAAAEKTGGSVEASGPDARICARGAGRGAPVHLGAALAGLGRDHSAGSPAPHDGSRRRPRIGSEIQHLRRIQAYASRYGARIPARGPRGNT